MADVTGGTPPTNASPFAVPADIKAVYDHFGDQAKYSVATAASLPASNNWLGRALMAQDSKILYLCTALPSTWTQAHLLADTGWITPTLVNGWSSVATQTVQYRRLNGVVMCRGRGTGGTTNTMFTLPAGFRPGQAFTQTVMDGPSTPVSVCRVVFETNGTIEAVAGTQPNLANVSPFPADL